MKNLQTWCASPHILGWLLVSVVSMTAITGCSLFGDLFDGHEDRYVGTVSFGFEEAAFRPCDSKEQWWVTGEVVQDIELARYKIDLLSMISEKTEGNLSDDEKRQLEEIIYQLRMVFVQQAQ